MAANHRALPQGTKPPGGICSPEAWLLWAPDWGNIRCGHAIAFGCPCNETRSLSLMPRPWVNYGTLPVAPNDGSVVVPIDRQLRF
jgi:hypothetical protein